MKIVLESEIKFFQNVLIGWFFENGRKFPWRKKSASNYEIIISEVFLQRTKAETVSKFLPQFFDKYPNWKYLGNATENELKVFIKPLGLYNQRGARIYRLAQEIKKRNGRFPRERGQLEEIPMMGQYITNAYELYILCKKVPLLDVNMARLLERYFGERTLSDIRDDPYLQTLSYRVVNVDNSRELNWAILDYASIICKKINPECNNCSLNSKCLYFASK
jgi:A/G-specific adenine glycosylase